MKPLPHIPNGTYVAGFRSRKDRGDWVVGFYAGRLPEISRHAIEDGEGQSFDPLGFPFVVPISAARGFFLAQHRGFLEVGMQDLYRWLHCPRTEHASSETSAELPR